MSNSTALVKQSPAATTEKTIDASRKIIQKEVRRYLAQNNVKRLEIVRHAAGSGRTWQQELKDYETGLESEPAPDKDDRYELTHKQFHTVLAAIQCGNVALIGPAGVGKTTIAMQAAEAMKLPFYFNGAIGSEYKLSGFIDAQSRIVSTPFKKAFTEGGVYLFDEIDASMPGDYSPGENRAKPPKSQSINHQFHDGGEIIIEQHQSYRDFVHYVANGKSNWGGALTSKADYYNFSETSSFQEAIDLAINGWPEGAAKISQIISEHAARNTYAVLPKQPYDVMGHYPSVPRFVAGAPDCMISENEDGENKREKIVRLHANTSYLGNVSEEKVFNYGAAFCIVVDQLEQLGMRVEISCYFSERGTNKHYYLLEVPIKAAQHQADINTMAFAFAHPAFFRRLGFAAMEMRDDVYADGDKFERIFSYGYGHTIKYPDHLKNPQSIYPFFFTDDLDKAVRKMQQEVGIEVIDGGIIQLSKAA